MLRELSNGCCRSKLLTGMSHQLIVVLEWMVWWVGWSDEWRAVQSVEVVSAVRQVLGSHQIPVGSQVAVIGTRDGCVRVWRLCLYDPLSCRPLSHMIIALNTTQDPLHWR